ncbi:MAG: UDP-N-acetylmuramate dehydrogenase [Treponema sp.]|nr:UDP-N-acetylmuramate dehydrogenase [Treponema sp.]
MKDTISRIIDTCKRENPCDAEIRYDEPMSAHTTFKAGGPADCWVRPTGEGFPAFAASLLQAACAADIPVFILGGGANIVVADRGIRGIVLDTGAWAGEMGNKPVMGMSFRSGTALDDAAEIAAAQGLSGLEFVAGMPGSIGGAVWMNARCYEREIADVLLETEIIEFGTGPCTAAGSRQQRIPVNRAEFGYKRSPFQGQNALILSAVFCLVSGDEHTIRGEMEAHRRDRESKGHFRFPSAGSAFKNNRDFGKPSGQIIDELGLKGLRIGGAQVAPFHGNIIINTGNAAASDIRSLADEVAAQVKAATGFTLEPEILFIGDWYP